MFRFMGMNDENYKLLMDRESERSPLQRNVKDDEVAKAIIFLTSEQ